MNATKDAPQGITQVVAELKERSTRGSASLGDLLELLGERGFGAAMLLFALPNAVLMSSIPLMSTVLSVPLMLVALQLTFGASRPWLPKKLLARRLSESNLTKLVVILEKTVGWIERFRLVKPRLAFLSGQPMQAISGAVTILCAVTLFMPIPLGNFFPGLGATLIALGLIERDGLVLTLGNLLGLASSFFFLGGILFGVGAGITFLSDL